MPNQKTNLRRNPFAPRIFKDRRTGRWTCRCGPCGYTLSADSWDTNVADVLRHIDGASHAGYLVLARKVAEAIR